MYGGCHGSGRVTYRPNATVCSLSNFFVMYIGPWFFGEVLTGVYGTVGVHGVSIKGHFIPGPMTYLHGIIEVRESLYTFVHFDRQQTQIIGGGGRGKGAISQETCITIIIMPVENV